MEFMHAKKVIHRDLKLQNIFLTGSNTIKIGDFGISRALEQTGLYASTVIGTPHYLSPEVCKSEPYTSKSDVWALGCILYELCTLKKAFAGDNLLGLVYKIVTEDAPPIS
jgi:NIMA (never in mitosis gene a)-related kinase